MCEHHWHVIRALRLRTRHLKSAPALHLCAGLNRCSVDPSSVARSCCRLHNDVQVWRAMWKSEVACMSEDCCQPTCSFLDPPLPLATNDDLFPHAVQHHAVEIGTELMRVCRHGPSNLALPVPHGQGRHLTHLVDHNEGVHVELRVHEKPVHLLTWIHDVLFQASREHVRSALRGREGIMHTLSRTNCSASMQNSVVSTNTYMRPSTKGKLTDFFKQAAIQQEGRERACSCR